jgi:hypothetical protein
VRQHHGLAQLDSDEMPLLARQLIALSTLANATLSGSTTAWEAVRGAVSLVLELPPEQLQEHFEACAAGARD